MFTLLLQGKGFLEGTTLPPIMTYWGLAELPGKKENTHSVIWSKHSDFQHSTHWHEHVQCLTGSQQFCAVVGFFQGSLKYHILQSHLEEELVLTTRLLHSLDTGYIQLVEQRSGKPETWTW